MKYILTKKFEKQFSKLSNRQKEKTIGKIEILVSAEVDGSLRKHCLHGKFKGAYSINVTGDIRAVYIKSRKDLIKFVAIGTHSQLYK